jgi:hypothetical protein
MSQTNISEPVARIVEREKRIIQNLKAKQK